ncbi:malignant fibrous histiocytoma-amplified sequence 1 homolog [Alligator sinensis]|uniref:Malignant fibrous histiocytoma-amplified sequence 1 homolog n=1 Tax=Alligator sinensis TaxID=38654 RepID=A0A1U8CW62_ALLSI|nr:malignant fibrous histiocytoma-amplified sequence 1 homolog [Alligator sinensis]XP_025054331.1 malignant fibrous histiocytoma-amplified sequence 1 homolog [Alligator sinensis]
MAKHKACQELSDYPREVTLSTLRLRVLPPTVLCDTSLESLNLDRNKLKRIPGISQLCNLKKLILSKNDIADFPEEIRSLVHLEKLDLNQNQIRVIPEGIFSCLLKLKHLRLNNNRLSDLPKDLATCQGSLQYLNLSNNLFQDIPQAVLKLASLQDFYIQNNMLHQLPVGLFTGRPLKMFKANGNPLREPPGEVCAGGIQQILSYFSQLQTCQAQEDRRVKTMFLGASLAGKSTICKSLQQRRAVPLSKEARTIGIEISEFRIQDFTFLFWDFAGQLEYYMTHHVFITPQALVILVINFQQYQLNDKVFKELVGFWINNLFMRIPNSVVLPVGTHIDCCDEGEVEAKKQDVMNRIQAMLEERRTSLIHFINNLEDSEESEIYVDQWNRLKETESCTLTILDLISVNCTDYQDIKKLEAAILGHVRNEEIFPNVIRMLPPVYKEVEAAIVDIVQSEGTAEHSMMDLNLLLSELAQRENLTGLGRELLQDVLRYLHHIGLIIWYEEVKQMESMVFLRPAFLITMFKILVRYHLVQQLESISVDTLVGEHATIRDQSNWVWTFKSKAMLCQQAMRALVKHQLPLEGMEDVFEEMMGRKSQKGKLFSLLEHFEICLEVRNTEKLNPAAREFVPGKPWEVTQGHSEACYLFPMYLNHSKDVSEVWGGDHAEDLHLRAYFSPEVPESFFQRLMVKACSFYSAHWVAKMMCLLVCSGKPLLIKENNQKGYSYIELRCRKPAERIEFRITWDLVMAIVSIIRKLSDEWPGLHICLKTPCRTAVCPAEFVWPDLDGKSTVTKEDIKTCGTCSHQFRTELLLPKVLSDVEAPPAQPAAHYYVTSYGTTTFGPSNVHVSRQNILDE